MFSPGFISRSVVLSTSIFIGMLSLSACEKKATLAKVDNQEITAEELIYEAQLQGLKLTSSNSEKLLQQLIDRRSAEIQINKSGIDATDIERDIQRLILDRLTKRFEQEELPRLEVTDADVRHAYEKGIERFYQQERVRIALIAFSHATTDKGIRIADQSWEQLINAIDADERDHLFQKIASTYSSHRASRYRGGDIGFLEKGMETGWPKTVVNAAFSLTQDGEISAVIESEDSLYLLKRVTHQAGYTRPLAEVETLIRNELLAARYQTLKGIVREKIRDDIKIKLNTEAIASVAVEPQVEEKTQQEFLPGPPLSFNY